MRKGELHSAESRAKISASKTGKQFTKEHAEAIRRALAGRPKSPSHKRAIAEGIRSARLARQQVSITAQPTESMKETSNQKRIFRATIHHTDKQADSNGFTTVRLTSLSFSRTQ